MSSIDSNPERHSRMLPVNADGVAVNPATDTVILAATVVSVAASATVQALLTAAGVTISPAVKKITLSPAGTIHFNVGAAATAASPSLAAGAWYEIGITADTDLRLYAVAATSVTIVQEG